ncbi:Zinc ABC transporter, periplasmic-binding protein ZnuA [Roseibacterium elongatum DSM 19469]|uniref:High-affinity zinc uptake system protein ZnuA n=1 Tax=Roseicyclus elongatus DSM 19469 TaxID=1294273 RepID=W8RTH7_9RHOB|nr:Zinc ABC transporter, periplasmic-binding protein ZnuA [Roseibacterium elongatum DSM 19469]
MGGTAMADVPSVAVDIAPIHSLVARVMDGVGEPNLILPPGASPHEYNLRPSEADALQNADVVIWMGDSLAPWMTSAVRVLAEGAGVLTLLEAEETTLLPFREGALFEAHSHGDEDHDHDHDDHADDDHDHEDHADAAHDHDDHGHDDHDHDDDHAHDDEHADEEHADADGHDHGHDHGAFDPHAWLSPANAAAWLNLIAAELSAADPENAGAYFANAAAAQAELEAVSAEVTELLDPVRGGNFIVFHDAYQYFETAFDFPASGAISLGDAQDPSPARIAEIQERVRDAGVQCVLAEPQFDPGLVATVLEGTEANTGVIDPLGVDLDVGPTLYPQLMRNLATTLAECLSAA